MDESTAQRQCRLISVDGQINEPGDLWTSWVATKFRGLVGRIESFDEGDAWVIPGVHDPVPFGFGAGVDGTPA